VVNIALEYQPFPFLKYTRKINGAFPSSFEDIKPAQLIAISCLINQSISDTDFLKIMTGFRKFYIKQLSDIERYKLMQLFDPFMDIKPYNTFIIPKIDTWTTQFFCPKPKLAGMSFAQFIFAESYFEDYQTDKNPTDLHKFVASLYLPELHGFDENLIPAAALAISKVKPEIPEAIALNYILIKEWLAQAYPMIFQQKEEVDENYEKPKKTHKNPGNSGWIKIFESVVGDDLVNHDRYALLPLHNVLRWMTTKIIENIKRK
jgi:hypothetical protein